MTLGADAADSFAAITDFDQLPEWNKAIEKVIHRPSAHTRGAVWTVQMHPSRPVRWQSVSTLGELDADKLPFAYRTVNAHEGAS